MLLRYGYIEKKVYIAKKIHIYFQIRKREKKIEYD